MPTKKEIVADRVEVPLLEKSLTPFELDVGFATFKIVYEDKLIEREHAFGETDFDKHTIRIQSGLDEGIRKETFWHEVMHVVAELAGVGGHPEEEDVKALINPISNEELVIRLSRTMILIFRLNPWLKEVI